MTIQRLKFMPYAQAHIEEYNGNIFLISYRTKVACLTRDRFIECYGLYSRTTIRHIGAFMKEYGRGKYGTQLNYYDAKKAYLGHYAINVDTGEIHDLPY